jgi:DNA replication and repair protein RecF
MYCAHLSLISFRNYARLELALSPGITIVVGDNAQGKSNLLEALYLLATTKSFRASADRELINWRASGSELSYARLIADVRRAGGREKVEIVVREEPRIETTEPANGPTTSKRLKINDVPRRAIDFLGAVNVVMFAPTDIELVDGSPSVRRRYLDITISQVDPRYVRALSRYNRVLVQRNHLLRQLRERHGRPEHLEPWDQELADAGAYVIQQRAATIELLGDLSRDVFRELTGRLEQMEVAYRPSVELPAAGAAPTESAGIARAFLRQLQQSRGREIAAGASLSGPHRDDLAFLVDGRPMGTYGSRGQQRTVALALKLAEAQFLRRRAGEEPILLLDDVLSELDESRRGHVLEAIADTQQVIFTSTDLEPYAPDFLARASVLTVCAGTITGEQPAPVVAASPD